LFGIKDIAIFVDQVKSLNAIVISRLYDDVIFVLGARYD